MSDACRPFFGSLLQHLAFSSAFSMQWEKRGNGTNLYRHLSICFIIKYTNLSLFLRLLLLLRVFFSLLDTDKRPPGRRNAEWTGWAATQALANVGQMKQVSEGPRGLDGEQYRSEDSYPRSQPITPPVSQAPTLGENTTAVDLQNRSSGNEIVREVQGCCIRKQRHASADGGRWRWSFSPHQIVVV